MSASKSLGVVDPPADPGNFAPAETPAIERDDFPLRDVLPGCKDKRGREVLDVLWAVHDFRIYKTAFGISPHFSDDIEVAHTQRKHYLDLGEQLAHMNHLVHLLGKTRLLRPARSVSAPEIYYEREVARAIAQALTGEVEAGKATLRALALRLEKRLTNRGRVIYFAMCVSSVLLIVAAAYLTLVVGDFFAGLFGVSTHEAALAAIMGSIGALLSTASSLRKIEVDPGATPLMSWVYGGTRMLVGVLGAIVLYIAVRAGIVLDFMFVTDDPSLESSLDPYKLAFVGILAGFSERLVPNLLERRGGFNRPRSVDPADANAADGTEQDDPPRTSS